MSQEKICHRWAKQRDREILSSIQDAPQAKIGTTSEHNVWKEKLMLRRRLLSHLTRWGIPRSYESFSFVAIVVLFFAFTLPGQSQIFKANPVLYQSGGNLAEAIAVADVNKDGNPDVIVVNAGVLDLASVGVLLGNGDGTLQPAVTYPVKFREGDAVAIGDLNGDGWPDLVVGANDGEGVVSLNVLLNKGDGTFEAAVGYSAGFDVTSVAIADVNGDGKPDVIALDESNNTFSHSVVAVLLGNGNGRLDKAVTYELTGDDALSLTAADLNGDGKPDLVVTNGDNHGNAFITVLLNNGDGTFPSQVGYPTADLGSSVILGDVNGDGKLDAVVADRGGSLSVLFGKGDGTFGAATGYPTGLTLPASVAMGDFNGDGTPDLAVVGAALNGVPSGKVAVLLNNGHGTFQSPILYRTGGRNAFSVAVGNLQPGAKPDLVVADGCDGFSASCPLGGGVAVLLGVPATTKTTVTTSTSPSQSGQPVTFTATVTATEGPIPNGTTITFYNNSSRMGTAKTTNGAAKFTTSSLIEGTHTIKASYQSSAFFKASAGTVTQVEN
jgi:hypothetical protein